MAASVLSRRRVASPRAQRSGQLLIEFLVQLCFIGFLAAILIPRLTAELKRTVTASLNPAGLMEGFQAAPPVAPFRTPMEWRTHRSLPVLSVSPELYARLVGSASNRTGGRSLQPTSRPVDP